MHGELVEGGPSRLDQLDDVVADRELPAGPAPTALDAGELAEVLVVATVFALAEVRHARLGHPEQLAGIERDGVTVVAARAHDAIVVEQAEVDRLRRRQE